MGLKYTLHWYLFEWPEYFWNTKILKRSTAYQISREVSKHRDELVIDQSEKVVRVLGWTRDLDAYDYYYITQDAGGKIVFQTCVGRMIWLKNQLSYLDYDNLENVWRLNSPNTTEGRKEAEKLISGVGPWMPHDVVSGPPGVYCSRCGKDLKIYPLGTKCLTVQENRRIHGKS